MKESEINMPEDNAIIIENSDLKVSFSSEVQEELSNIPTVIARANQALSIDIENSDASEIVTLKRDLETVSKVERKINKAITSTKSKLNSIRDEKINMLIDILNDYQYDELSDVTAKIKLRKSEIDDLNRARKWQEIEKHWHMLETHVFNNVNGQSLFDLLPNLNFQHFVRNNPNLVTAAESSKVTSNVLLIVTDYILNRLRDMQAILHQQSEFQTELIKEYNQTFDLNTTLQYNTTLLVKKQEDLKRVELARQKANEAILKQPEVKQPTINKQPETEEKTSIKTGVTINRRKLTEIWRTLQTAINQTVKSEDEALIVLQKIDSIIKKENL